VLKLRDVKCGAGKDMNVTNPRQYGDPPYGVAVIHGGPGAAGEMAPVAVGLASSRGVLEPLQTAESLDAQVRELLDILTGNADPPVTLVGWSWGAWLGLILAAEQPSLVKKLIIVGSPPFEERYVARIADARLRRMSEEEREELDCLMEALNEPGGAGQLQAMARLGELLSGTDSFDPVPHEDDVLEYRPDIYREVWKEAERLRSSGRLLAISRAVRCPVVAIHGEDDPHPYEGVRGPLEGAVRDFRFVLLKECGHKPWIERSAREGFYEALERELR
jgi:pimeloyl-ACP methyl ester carboxylesterase